MMDLRSRNACPARSKGDQEDEEDKRETRYPVIDEWEPEVGVEEDVFSRPLHATYKSLKFDYALESKFMCIRLCYLVLIYFPMDEHVQADAVSGILFFPLKLTRRAFN